MKPETRIENNEDDLEVGGKNLLGGVNKIQIGITGFLWKILIYF